MRELGLQLHVEVYSHIGSGSPINSPFLAMGGRGHRLKHMCAKLHIHTGSMHVLRGRQDPFCKDTWAHIDVHFGACTTAYNSTSMRVQLSLQNGSCLPLSTGVQFCAHIFTIHPHPPMGEDQYLHAIKCGTFVSRERPNTGVHAAWMYMPKMSMCGDLRVHALPSLLTLNELTKAPKWHRIQFRTFLAVWIYYSTISLLYP